MSSTILIVDDDPVQRRLLEAMVRRLGFDAEVRDGGEAAMQRIEGGEGPRSASTSARKRTRLISFSRSTS